MGLRQVKTDKAKVLMEGANAELILFNEIL